jgi:hypothetical protein
MKKQDFHVEAGVRAINGACVHHRLWQCTHELLVPTLSERLLVLNCRTPFCRVQCFKTVGSPVKLSAMVSGQRWTFQGHVAAAQTAIFQVCMPLVCAQEAPLLSRTGRFGPFTCLRKAKSAEQHSLSTSELRSLLRMTALAAWPGCLRSTLFATAALLSPPAGLLNRPAKKK